MAQHSPRSLKHEYEVYVENEIENYKESVSRSAILKIGDEAAAVLRAGEQFSMDEILLWAEVDRIIRKRLRIPAYDTWRKKRVKLLAEYRRPEHWGIPADGMLAREIHPPAESKVLVAGGEIDRTALYLAAHGCDGRGGAERDQHLLLRRTERDLLERALGEDVAALIVLGEAAAEHQAERERGRDGKRTSA